MVDEYHELETEVDNVTRELSELSDQNTIDKQVVTDLERALSLEAPPGSDDVKVVYQEAGLLLPSDVLRRFDDVHAFHESVIRDRRGFLEAEVRSARTRIDQRGRRQRELDERRGRILGILRTSGALESFTELQTEYARVQAAVAHLRRQHEHALAFETGARSRLSAHSSSRAWRSISTSRPSKFSERY